jgi:ammonia channel protein AmtB
MARHSHRCHHRRLLLTPQSYQPLAHIDEGLDVFKLHGICGMIGSFLIGIFTSASVSSLGGSLVASGEIDGNGIQVEHQLADVVSVASSSFTVTCILLMIIIYPPGLHFRISDEAEIQGLDFDQFFEEDVGDWSQGHFGFGDGVRDGGKGVLDGKTISGPATPPKEAEKTA